MGRRRGLAAALGLAFVLTACSQGSRPGLETWRPVWERAQASVPAESRLEEPPAEATCQEVLGALREVRGDVTPAPDPVIGTAVDAWFAYAENLFFSCFGTVSASDPVAGGYGTLERLRAEVEVAIRTFETDDDGGPTEATSDAAPAADGEWLGGAAEAGEAGGAGDVGEGGDASGEVPFVVDHARETQRLVAEARLESLVAETQAARRRAEEEARRRAETRRVQEVLAAGRYYAGPIDGAGGPATRAAVMAFQKVHGLARDGVIGPQTLGAIGSPREPVLVGGAATRIEVDLDRQVVHLVKGGARIRTMNASSGNGEVYTWPDGRVARADTPGGTFTIYRRVTGLRDGDLGSMYDPLYFHQGWAIHGSNHVPGYPASHGCVRLPRADALWLASQVPNGTEVVVHGSTNAFDPRTESVWLERG